MNLLLLIVFVLCCGSVSSKDGILPTIPINKKIEKLIPKKFLQPLKNLNQTFQDFNEKVDMEKLKPALELGGEAGKAAMASLTNLISLILTGHYFNPFAIGKVAQHAYVATMKSLEALEVVAAIPLKIPGAEAIKFVLTQLSKFFKFLRCLKPTNCFKWGR